MQKKVEEEGIIIKSYGEKISKELDVFYNPIMKLNRDISMLVLKTYFTKYNKKKIKFCDPMGASGIRELRFIKDIPEIFEKITISDISQEAIDNIENNFKLNNLSMEKIELKRAEAINTISSQFYDFIEIDPFGSPVPFLDIAIQRIKHNGILSITATDTATLCGTYPKKTLRKYGMSVKKTLCYDEIGLRNLIAYCQIQIAKYDKSATPLISYASDHYYKIFLKIEEGRKKADNMINELKYIKYNQKTQEIKISEIQKDKDYFGKTFVGKLKNENFLKELEKEIKKEENKLIKKDKKITKLIKNILNEGNGIGYIIPAKLQKEFKISTCPKYEILEKELKKLGFTFSKPHNNGFGIKTNCPSKKIIEIMRKEEKIKN